MNLEGSLYKEQSDREVTLSIDSYGSRSIRATRILELLIQSVLYLVSMRSERASSSADTGFVLQVSMDSDDEKREG